MQRGVTERQPRTSAHRWIVAIAAALVLMLCPTAGRAMDVTISPQALERTLQAQLFNAPDGRYYLRGSASSACAVYAEKPHVSFQAGRIVVHVHAHARLGEAVRGTCVGVGLNTDADVSFVPEAEGESVGFRDARIERLSDSRELNFLLVPFLSRKLPSEMKVNAADLIRKLLTQSVPSTGYAISLDSLKIHSMQVVKNVLVVDVDAGVGIE